MRLSKPVSPHEGESLASLVTRAALVNGFPRPGQMLNSAGLADHRIGRIICSRLDWTSLAGFLGCSLDELGNCARGAESPVGPSQVLCWHGTRLSRSHYETRKRCVPLGVEFSYHRAEWNLHALSYCPDSMKLLTSECPECGGELAWFSTRGVDRCEHCEVCFADLGGPSVRLQDQKAARFAARLVAHSFRYRSQSLARLPGPLRQADAGAVFAVLVEVAVAAKVLKRELTLEIANRWRDPDRLRALQPSDLAEGWRLLERWPHGLDELLEKLPVPKVSRKSIDAHLGPFRRVFRQSGRHEEHVPILRSALVQRAIAVWPHLDPDDAKGQTRKHCILLRDASKKYRLGASTVKRLVPDGDCLVGRTDGPKGWIYLHEERFAESVAELRDLWSHENAASELGLAPHLMPFLMRADLISPATDQDAIVMSGMPDPVPARSIMTLKNSILQKVEPSSQDLPLLVWLMRKTLYPQAWVQLLFDLAGGQLKVFAEEGSELSLGNLRMPHQAFTTWMAGRHFEPIDPTINVSGLVAARITGWRDVSVLGMVRSGHLRGEVRKGKSEVSLAALQEWVGSNSSSSELSWAFGKPSRWIVSRLHKAGVIPTLRGERLILWPTDTAYSVLA